VALSSKTVYVLGAGFAADARLPLQAGILQRIQEFDPTLLEAPAFVAESFLPAKEKLTRFLNAAFPEPQVRSLEDVFTLLDQTIARGQHCLGHDCLQLGEIRDALKTAILFVFHEATANVPAGPADFYRRLAAYLIEQRVGAGQTNDPMSIISLNWDSLFENDASWCIREAEGQDKVDIDYCCYTTPLGSTPHTPSLMQKATGMFNIKLMKLHGSATWLLCPSCNRLYTGVGGPEGAWELYAKPQDCPQCRALMDAGGVAQLEPFFITPTFLKVFDNAHIQMTWHNAYVDLAEASDVVFVGYSLPDADYHVRTLLRRAVRPNAKIRVVLATRDMPIADHPELNFAFAGTRYLDFFGDRAEISYAGLKEFFEPILGDESLGARIVRLRETLRRHRRRSRRRPRGGWH
jgi:hypothetical protein